jgi:hypothetical protein
MERETGIEPATNSLEGCDSTTELLPPSRSPTRPSTCARDLALRRASPPYFLQPTPLPTGRSSQFPLTAARSAACRQTNSATNFLCPAPTFTRRASESWWGGEGSNLRSPKAAGLQPAAIDRSATSPKYISCCSSGHDCFGSQHLYPLRPWAVALKPAHVIGVRVSDVSLKSGVTVPWSWRRDSNPRPADYKSAALPA